MDTKTVYDGESMQKSSCMQKSIMKMYITFHADFYKNHPTHGNETEQT